MRWRRAAIGLLALLPVACAHLPEARRQQAEQLAVAARSDAIDCRAADACAAPSLWREQAQGGW